MVDVSGVGGPSGTAGSGSDEKTQMKGYLQELQQQVGNCSKAAQEAKEKLMHDIMSHIKDLQGKVEKLQSMYPGSFNSTDMTQMLNQLHSVTSHGADASPHDMDKLLTQIGVVHSQL